MIIENTTPIAALTVGDLKELLMELFLAPACMQQGRKIVIDVEMAVELFKTHKDGNN